VSEGQRGDSARADGQLGSGKGLSEGAIRPGERGGEGSGEIAERKGENFLTGGEHESQRENKREPTERTRERK
jgi:hypothetical protein